MPLSLSQARDELAGLVQGTNTSNITNLNGVWNRAARKLLASIDPAETRVISSLTLYDKVFDYAAPSDLKENRILDLRPQVSRGMNDAFTLRTTEELDHYKDYSEGNNWIAVQDNAGTKSLKIAKRLTPGAITINGATALTGEGTWAATAPASGLVQDTVTKIFGAGSLRFNLTGTGGYIENSTMSQVNLTDHDEVSSFFVYVHLPSTAFLTSLTLRWGNDTSNFWSRTITAPHLGSFKTGWNLCRFDWAGATETGTVTPSTIDYLRLTFTTDTSSVNNIRVNKFFSSLPQSWDIEYYSTFLFTNSAGTRTERVTNDNDTINLDTASFNLFLFEAAMAASQQVQGADGVSNIQYLREELANLYSQYKANNPSVALRPQTTYYRI